MTWEEDVEAAVDVIFQCFLSKGAVDEHWKENQASDIDLEKPNEEYPMLQDEHSRSYWFKWNLDALPWAIENSNLLSQSNNMISNLDGAEVNTDRTTIEDAIKFFVQSRGEGLLSDPINDGFNAEDFREELLTGLMNSDKRDFVNRFERIYEDKVTIGESLEAKQYIEIANMKRWLKGGKGAIRFCRLAGLPLIFAGRRESEKIGHFDRISYDRVPKMANFQEGVAGLISETLFSREESKRRGLVILPTGSGKTRVTSESLLKWYLDSTEPRVVLWICHRKELCYQASETFERIWQRIAFDEHPNEAGRDLNIHRFWGDVEWSDNEGNSDDSVLSNNIDRNHGALVICTIDTLHKIVTNGDLSHREALSGIRDPDCVVIDEAHRFETPKYRSTLAALGVQLNLNSADPYKGVLIGLTATPYRSNEDQMAYMHRRYGSRFLLPSLISEQNPSVDHVRESIRALREDLQEQKILAKARVEMVDFQGPRRRVGRNEIDDFEDLTNDWLQTNLANSDERNQAMIGKILELRDAGRKSILFFGLSVEHSKIISMTLNRLGIMSESVDSSTAKGSRRVIIERFRKGEIEVLSNYGIFDTGFDAPNVDAIVISRPVGSEVLLQQIVGRGLRGTVFGGTEDCVIVAVQDLIMISREDEEGTTREENYGLEEVEIKGVLGDE